MKIFEREEMLIEEEREEGREEGIAAFILDGLEEKLSEQRVCEKLQKRFSLSEEKAMSLIVKYKELYDIH